MDTLLLVRPAPEHRAQAADYLNEHIQAGEPHLHGGAILEQMEYDAWLQLLRDNSDPQTTHAQWVTASTFFVVRETDGRIIGMVDIRHRLNDFLAAYGGHIGYGVRPTERRKGYATAILQMALRYAKETLGLSRVMVACYQDNEPSRKTIQKCGGKLERTFVHTDGKMVEVYWIALQD